MFCNKCGANIPDGSQVCNVCGAPQMMNNQQPYGQPMQQPYGQPMQQPYGQPMQQPYGQPYGRPMPAGNQQMFKAMSKKKNAGSGIVACLTIMIINLIIIAVSIFTQSCYKLEESSSAVSNNDITKAIYDHVDGLQTLDLIYGIITLVAFGLSLFALISVTKKKRISQPVCMAAGIVAFAAPIFHGITAGGKLDKFKGDAVRVGSYYMRLDPDVPMVTLASLIGLGVAIASCIVFKKNEDVFIN